MKPRKHYILPAVLIAMLAACGGGGDGGNGGGNGNTDNPPGGNTNNPPGGSTNSGNSGSVSSLFAPSANPRYHLIGPGNQATGVLSNQEQGSDGAVYKINSYALSGTDRSVLDINGDADFTLGRWNAGTLTKSDGTTQTLNGSQGSAYHYILFNTLSAFPTSGTYNCDTGKLTTPTRSSGSSASPASGSVMGSASVVFDSNGAKVTGSLSVNASGNTSVSLDSTPAGPTTTSITGSYFGNGTGAAVQVVDGSSGKVAVVGAYRAVISSNGGSSAYIGTYRFVCTAAQGSL